MAPILAPAGVVIQAGVVYSTADHLNVQMHMELKYNVV